MMTTATGGITTAITGVTTTTTGVGMTVMTGAATDAVTTVIVMMTE